VDGQRFLLKFDQFLRGYRRRRRIIPKAWMGRVDVQVKRSSWASSTTSSGPGTQSVHPNDNSGWNRTSGDVALLPDESSHMGQQDNRKKGWFK
jgi:hypothetical protein